MNFSVFLKSRGVWHRLLSVVVLSLVFMICAEAQIKYTPTQAIQVIESLGPNDPNSPTQGQHGFGTVGQHQATGSAKVTSLTPAQRLQNIRVIYYNMAITELEIESTHNNTIAGTNAALTRAYNRLLPNNSANERYTNIINVHNALLQRLKK